MRGSKIKLPPDVEDEILVRLIDHMKPFIRNFLRDWERDNPGTISTMSHEQMRLMAQRIVMAARWAVIEP